MPRFPVLPLALFLVLTCFASAASTERLIGLRSGEMPALPAEARVINTLDGTVVAFGGEAVWALAPGAADWRRLEANLPGAVVAVVPRAPYALLSGADGETARSLARVALGPDTLSATPILELPEALRQARATILRDAVYVFGISLQGGPAMLMASPGEVAPAWVRLPGPPEPVAEVRGFVAQDAAVFALVGEPGAPSTRLWRWRAEDGWTRRSTLEDGVVPGTARATGQAHIALIGSILDPATGQAQMRVYQTITDMWATFGQVDLAAGAGGASWGNGMVLIAPAADGGAARVKTVEIEMKKRLLRSLDWIVIVVYLAGMAGIGFYCYMKEKRGTTADYFLGGRSIPFWAAGLSLYATGTSAVSYIAIPAKSFATDWVYLSQNVVGLVTTIFVAIWIVPLIRRLDLMSVYGYLEMRFHPTIRMMASGINIILQLGGRMSVVLFLPSLAISAVTGLDVIWSICIMGLITIVYTVMGGMKAVIWTDVIQVFVMLGGAFFAVGYVIMNLDGGAGSFFDIAAADNKLKLFDLRFDLTKATLWGFIFFAIPEILTYPKDQVMMQRVLSTKSAKEAGWSIWTLAAVVVPGSLTFFAIGTALYAFYKQNPEKMNPLLTLDATFPHFIAAELPVGVTGAIIAGIFAASMSTLSSCINSVATLVSVDFYEKLAKNPNPKTSVRIAEALTIVAGLIGVGTAVLLSFFDIRSFFDLSLELAGLLGGGFAGTYALGIFTKRANWQGAAIGICVSIVVTFVAWSMHLVHSFFYAAIAVVTCIVVGYIASWFFPPPSRSLLGLTVFERAPKDTAPTT